MPKVPRRISVPRCVRHRRACETYEVVVGCDDKSNEGVTIHIGNRISQGLLSTVHDDGFSH